VKWLQNPSQVYGDNLNNIRCKTNRTFRYKKIKYLEEKVNELETNCDDKVIRELRRHK
jgi:hypothetical protein